MAGGVRSKRLEVCERPTAESLLGVRR